MNQNLTNELIDFLADAINFFDNQADADMIDGSYKPNRAMQLMTEAENLLNRVEKYSEQNQGPDTKLT